MWVYSISQPSFSLISVQTEIYYGTEKKKKTGNKYCAYMKHGMYK